MKRTTTIQINKTDNNGYFINCIADEQGKSKKLVATDDSSAQSLLTTLVGEIFAPEQKEAT